MIRSVPREALAQPIRDASDARRFASSIIRARQQHDVFDARAVLSEFPELEGYGSAVLDLVYEEFSRRADSGEVLDADAFADRFPQLRSAVLEHIRAHQLLERCFGDQNPVWPEAGDTVLGCEIQEEIGRGAFSRVFLARQSALGGRQVVVKFCPSGAHEAQLLGKLEHEHIVPVHSVETDAERRLNAIVMPFHGRATLRDVVDYCFSGDAVPGTAATMSDAVCRIDADHAASARPARAGNSSYVEAVVQIMLDIARGLAHAHRKGVLHADIKPSNVLIDASLRARLLDFNLSHDSDALTNMTGGTVPYMAPEQLLALAQRREPTPTVAADVYAFGATLYESLTGKSPYGAIPAGLDRTTLAEWLLQRRQSGWETLDHAGPHVPKPIRTLVTRSLSFDPRERPAALDEVAAVLSRELRPLVRLLRRVQRNPSIAALAVGIAAVALGTAITAIAFVDPAHVDYFDDGHREFLAGNYARAVEYFDSAERCLPADAPPEFELALRFERGRARLQLRSSDEYDKAFQDFQRVIALDPQHAAAYACRGYTYVIGFNADGMSRDYLTQFSQALLDFRRARDYGLDTFRLRYDIEFCRLQIEPERVDGIAALQQLTREVGVPDDVLASAYFALVKAAMAQPKDAVIESQNIAELLRYVGHCGPVFEKAGGAYLVLAQTQITDGDSSGAAKSVDAALACFESALQHGVPRSGIDQLRDRNPLIGGDARFVDLKPAGDPIESSPEPLSVLDPLNSPIAIPAVGVN
jgi:tetratricopeptide (TPR) repeat protein